MLLLILLNLVSLIDKEAGARLLSWAEWFPINANFIRKLAHLVSLSLGRRACS